MTRDLSITLAQMLLASKRRRVDQARLQQV